MEHKKIAVIVQRAGHDIVGGSEGYALKFAKILSKQYSVDLITSCAQDHFSWENHYSTTPEPINNNLQIVRFEVDFPRTKYWHHLNKFVHDIAPIEQFTNASENDKKLARHRINQLPLGFCNQFIKHQGPYSSSLLEYLERKQSDYDVFIFFTYLYATSYFGAHRIRDKSQVILVPTFHDEPFAYLPVFKRYQHLNHAFLTEPEQDLAEKLIYQSRPQSSIIGFGLTPVDQPVHSTKTEKYFIYAGRLDHAKAVDTLYKMFDAFVKNNPGYKLYTIGKGPLKSFKHPKIVYKGFVDENEKYRLISGSLGLINPSALESLGIVIMEAFMMKTPVVVNGRSEVLRSHVEKSKGGFYYKNQEEFNDALLKLDEASVRSQLGSNGLAYFNREYVQSIYEDRILTMIESTLSS